MKVFRVIVFLVLVTTLLSFQMQPDKKRIEKGRKLAKSCVHCHGTTKGVFAWPLQRIRLYRSQDWLVRMLANPAAFIAVNSEAAALFKNKPIMQAFPTYSKDDINAVLDYLDSLPYSQENYKHRKVWKTL